MAKKKTLWWMYFLGGAVLSALLEPLLSDLGVPLWVVAVVWAVALVVTVVVLTVRGMQTAH